MRRSASRFRGAGGSLPTAAFVVYAAAAVFAIVGSLGPRVEAAAPGWDVTVGLAGSWRAGSWTPLRLVPPADLGAAEGDDVFVWAQDPDGRYVRAPATSLRPASDGTLEARSRVRVGRPYGRIVIGHSPRDATPRRGEETSAGVFGAAEAALPDPIPSTHRVLVVLGDLPAAGRAARLMTPPEAPPLTVVSPLDHGPSAAGASGADYDMADIMIVCGRVVTTMPPDMLTGIDAWVREGGRLVFCAGVSALDISRDDGPASTWLPGTIEQLVPLRRVAAIEAHARTGGLANRPGAAALEVPVLANRRILPGSVEVFEGTGATDLPLVIRSAHGLGVITWLGIDLDDGPFRGWTGTDSLIVRLLGGRTDDADTPKAVREPGAADLAGQLRTALERHGGLDAPPIATVPFEAIAGLGLLYVLALYPLDWWIASRGRPWLAWVTLPMFVALFSAAAWGIAEWRRPAEAAVARGVEMLDVDVQGSRVQGHCWSALWSDDNVAFGVDIVGTSPDAAMVSWFADAGSGFGGIDAPVPHPSLAATDYRYRGSLAALEGVPVAAAANRLFEGRWSRAARGGPLVTSTLSRDAQGILRGGITHHLPITIEGCRLAHGGWVYDIGTLAADVAIELRATRGPRSLAGALQRRTTVDDRDVPNRWDRDEPDPLRILEIAGFHAAAGGAGYTLMPGGRLGCLDLSPLLSVDRAVLYGTVADAPDGWATRWQMARAADQAAVEVPVRSVGRLVRVVIPLMTAGAEP